MKKLKKKKKKKKIDNIKWIIKVIYMIQLKILSI